jgi:UDP-glucose 4-epimerase
VRILVTGGAGYIGSATVRALLERGHDLIILDSLEFGSAQALEALGVAHRLVKGSVTDNALLDQIFEAQPIDAVMHFAAYKRGNESISQPAAYFWANVGGTFGLLDAMVRHGVKNFIFSSSGAIYGNPRQVPVTEDEAPAPQSPYGEGKVMVEQALPWYSRAHGLNYASLRYFNAAGAAPDGLTGEDLRYTSNLIPLAIKTALGLSPDFTIYGTDYPTPDGTCIRDFIHVADLAEAHVLALDYIVRNRVSATYNLGSGQGTTIRQVVETVRRLSGVDFEVAELPRRVGDVVELWADSRKARAELGWQPRYSLDDMVKTAYTWHAKEILTSYLAYSL